MTSESSEHEITDDVIQTARGNPNDWVYKIDGAFGTDDVPPEAVIGAWKVDASGNLTDKFAVNPKYQPKARCREQT